MAISRVVQTGLGSLVARVRSVVLRVAATIPRVVFGMLAFVALTPQASAQTTVTTDGDVEAQGFIGDGSQVTGVDAELLDSMDSSAFAQDSDLQNTEAMLLALQEQVDALGLARVPRTGQAAVFAAGDDGELQLGVTWPNPRFTDHGNGTVTDNLTGLIWLDDANCFGVQTWADALTKANALFDGCADCGGTNMDCGLTDGSLAGAWRLPNLRELQSLVHYAVVSPTVPNTAGTGKWVEGDPFSGVQSSFYWSSTTNAGDTFSGFAWFVNMNTGLVNFRFKGNTDYVWPVRGGQ